MDPSSLEQRGQRRSFSSATFPVRRNRNLSMTDNAVLCLLAPKLTCPVHPPHVQLELLRLAELLPTEVAERASTAGVGGAAVGAVHVQVV